MFEANVSDIKACIEDAFAEKCWSEEVSDQELQEVLNALALDFGYSEEEDYA